MYLLNIDRPTHATLHLAGSSDSRCQPQDKNPDDGYWQDFDTAREASRHALKLGLRFDHCKICFQIENKAVGPNTQIFTEI